MRFAVTDLQKEVQHFVLQILSPISKVEFDDIAHFSDAHWQVFLSIVEQQRIGPIIKWQLSNSHKRLNIPVHVSGQLDALHRQFSLQSLLYQRALSEIDKVLVAKAVPYCVLKGVYLALRCYPEPGLRPLRDIDILVPKQHAISAYQFLVEAGCEAIDDVDKPLEAYLDVAHHLPRLLSKDKSFIIEVHFRIFSPGHFIDLADDPEYWNRRLPILIGESRVYHESPLDLLLHLVEHSVLHHKFDNGPLIISDIAFLLKTHSIDWNLFWIIADRYQLTRSVLLVLKLVESYWGTLEIIWPASISADVDELNTQIQNASYLMLRDFDLKYEYLIDAEFAAEVPWITRLNLLFNRIFPKKQVLAIHYSLSADSSYIYLWIVRWRDLLLNRLPRFIKAKSSKQFRMEIDRLASLDQWLANRN